MNEGASLFQNGGLTIRPMAISDLDSVVEIEKISFAHPWTFNQFLSELRRQTVSRCYVAVACHRKGLPEPDPEPAGERIVGYIMAWLVADEFHITNLAVLLESRRCGVAAALLGHVITEAAREGVLWCQLEVRSSNTAARNLYHRFGFRPLGRRRRYYQDGEDAIVMGRELEPST